ncbi:MAG TPA: M23 family metallopeptidase [Candidatus Binataceae bacterium]|nr:M23 family metallopeptidase [Candidatus Binataceae bacterium]
MRKFVACAAAILAAVVGIGAEIEPVPPYNDPLYMPLLAHPAPHEAAILDGAGHKHSAYEVYLTNFGHEPITIKEVRMTGVLGGKDLFAEDATGPKLKAMYSAIITADRAAPQDPMLQPGASGILFMFADFVPERGVPDRFETSISILGGGGHVGSGTIDIASTPVSKDAPFVIQAPVRGEHWMAVNGPSNTSVHRRAVLVVYGRPYIGQRYAIDWVQVDDRGATYHGDKSDNRSYYCYDQPIHAVADGKIVEVQDGVAQNVPNSGKLATQIRWETLPGNHIVEDLGGGHFAAYAHLIPGSIKVKQGDEVHVGDVIAHLGNTGNSSEPHLHFQLCDTPSFIKSQGLPFAIDKYTMVDYKREKSGKEQKLATGATHQIEKEEPMENELDNFQPQ